MQQSASRFGCTEEEWASAKDEMRRAIMLAAQDRRMTSYTEVGAAVSTVTVEPFGPLMSHLLGDIFREEIAAGRPPLTAIVTHRSGDLEPGQGFYDQAARLGCDVSEPLVFWATAVQDVFTRYGRS